MPDERRALLTDTEREILETNGESIGEHYTDDYYYTVVSRVRKKIQRLNDDIQAYSSTRRTPNIIQRIVRRDTRRVTIRRVILNSKRIDSSHGRRLLGAKNRIAPTTKQI